MKKRILTLALAVVMVLASFSDLNGFVTAYATSSVAPSDSYTCTHKLASEYDPALTESKGGIIRYYCTEKIDGEACPYYYEVAVPRLPDVYVSKYRHSEDGLRARITVAQNYSVVDGKVSITMEDWLASQMKDKYAYEWESENVRGRSIEFKAKDVGIGTFDSKVKEYSLTVPVAAITACDEKGGVVVYLTTGAAMVRLSEDATAALIEQAKESIGVKVSCENDELNVELMADDEAVSAPNGVEVLYWVKDAGDAETASKELLSSEKYMSFATNGDFDLILVESLNGVVNCNK